MVRSLFVAIGVHKAAGMPHLDGVLTSVKTLSDWAEDRGYEVVRIDDERTRVKVARIKQELTPLDAATGDPGPKRLLDRPRIVVYFCGHGLHAPQDQYWILSAGPNQPGERISAVGFRDTLATYGPKQISIISDACRSGLVVQGLASSVVDAYEGQTAVVQKDRFFSSQDGQQSFAVPAKDGKPAYCVFSSVLVRALSEPADPEALDAVYLQTGRMIVSSQSLADYLDSKVPDAALGVGKWQVPQCDPGFRPKINDYVEFAAVAPGKDAAREAAVEAQRTNAQNERINSSRSEWRGPYVESLQRYMGPELESLLQRDWPGPLLLSSNSDAPHVEASESSGDYTLLTFKGQQSVAARRKWNVMAVVHKPFADSRWSGVAVVALSNLFAAIPLHRRLWCTAIIEKGKGPDGTDGGVELLAWGERYPSRPPRLSAAEALKGLSAGTLNAEDTAVLAEDMRITKHADPMYGIVAAYLYNAIGDVSNIQRMCYYYKDHDQDVPFDIAMLARLELKRRPDGGFYVDVPEVAAAPEQRLGAPSFVWEKTPAATVGVAGVTPLLRAGWQHIQASPHAVHKKCWELTPHLTGSPISTFRGLNAGAGLIEALKEL